MKIAIGADHGGYELKTRLLEHLRAQGHTVLDQGTSSREAVDYPVYAHAVAAAVASGQAERGVMIDGAGIGSCMVANKVRGVRAALCWNTAMAATTRQHNDSNVICFSADHTPVADAEAMLRAWLEASFEGGRHARRVEKIVAIENAE